MAVKEERLNFRGSLVGHNGWITTIGTAMDEPDMILTGSRDKSVMLWQLERTEDENGEKKIIGSMKRRLTGHSHFVSDLCLSKDRKFALSASWDGSIRLWNLEVGEMHKLFKGHTKGVLSVALSADNHVIVSGSMDKSIRVWNTIGNCLTVLDGPTGHDDWVTCVRFSPTMDEPVVVSCSRDKLVKVWDMSTWTLRHNLVGHTAHLNVVTVSPDGSLCASGGKDGLAMLWDLTDGKTLSTLETTEEINALVFSPTRYWLCAAFGSCFRIWDLESKETIGELDVTPKFEVPDSTTKRRKKITSMPIYCTSLAWSQDGNSLFAGFSDKTVHIYSLEVGTA